MTELSLVQELAESHEADGVNVNFGSLNEDEGNFLEAVKAGDLSTISQYLVSVEPKININCLSKSGKSALQIAVENEHKAVVELLVQHNASDDRQIALLQAVSKGLLDMAKILVKREKEQSEPALPSSINITPLILAVQLENYEMTKMLMEHGQVISEPHDVDCSCTDHGNDAKQNFLQSLFRYRTYQALASPMYICLSYELQDVEDPITRAFHLNTKLDKLADMEYESRHKYLELSDQCEEFAVSLLDECRNIEEIATIMGLKDWERLNNLDHQSRATNLHMLNLAVENGHEKFAGHCNTQEILNAVIYQEMPKWRYKKWWLKCLLAILFILRLPLTTFCYFFFPNTPLGRSMCSPVMKFVHQTGMLLLFLACLVASSLQDRYEVDTKISSIDLTIMIWVIGLLVQEITEVSATSLKKYLQEWWNLITVAMLGLFLLAVFLWIVAFALRQDNTKVCDFMGELDSKTSVAFFFTLVGNSAFSVASVLAFFHACSAFQVSSWLGPLQLSLYKMLLDIVKFLSFFFLLYLAFAVGLRRLYSFYEDFRLRENLYTREGKCNITEIAEKHVFSSFGGTLSNLFWAIFGMVELSEFQIEEKRFLTTEYTAKFLFGLFLVCVVLVSVNMLIAMMNNSYQKVDDNSDIAWKYSRTKMWLGYVQKGNCVPAPLNLIPNPHWIRHIFKRFCTKSELLINYPRTDDGSEKKKRKVKIKRLVQRYFRKDDRRKDLTKQIEEMKQELTEIKTKLSFLC